MEELQKKKSYRTLRRPIIREGKLIGEFEIRCMLINNGRFGSKLWYMCDGEDNNEGIAVYGFLEDGRRVFCGDIGTLVNGKKYSDYYKSGLKFYEALFDSEARYIRNYKRSEESGRLFIDVDKKKRSPIRLLMDYLDTFTIMKKEYKRPNGRIDAKFMVYQEDIVKDAWLKEYDGDIFTYLMHTPEVLLTAFIEDRTFCVKLTYSDVNRDRPEVSEIAIKKEGNLILDKIGDMLEEYNPLLYEERFWKREGRLRLINFIRSYHLRCWLPKYYDADKKHIEDTFDAFDWKFNNRGCTNGIVDFDEYVEGKVVRTHCYNSEYCNKEAEREREIRAELKELIEENKSKYGNEGLYWVEDDTWRIRVRNPLEKIYAIDMERGILEEVPTGIIYFWGRISSTYLVEESVMLYNYEKLKDCIRNNYGFGSIVKESYTKEEINIRLFYGSEELMRQAEVVGQLENWRYIYETGYNIETRRINGKDSLDYWYRLRPIKGEAEHKMMEENDIRVFEVLEEDVDRWMYLEDGTKDPNSKMYYVGGKGWYLTNRTKERRPKDYWMPQIFVDIEDRAEYDEENRVQEYIDGRCYNAVGYITELYKNEEGIEDDLIQIKCENYTSKALIEEYSKYTNIIDRRLNVPVFVAYFTSTGRFLFNVSPEVIFPNDDEDKMYDKEDNCLYFCCCCENYFTDCYDGEDYDGSWYCAGCACDELVTCDRCGERIRRDDAYYYDGEFANEGYYCDSCYEEIRDEEECGHYIEDYSYKPDVVYFVSKEESSKDMEERNNSNCGEDLENIRSKNRMYFGFELELKNDDDSELPKTIMETFSYNQGQNEDLVYLKRDGSIESTYGFEMVSHPMSYEFIEEEGKEQIGKILQVCREAGARGHNHAGMHIHVSKKFIDDDTKRKLYKFFEDLYNRDFLLCISQRKRSLIERWSSLGRWDGKIYIQNKDKKLRCIDISQKNRKKNYKKYFGDYMDYNVYKKIDEGEYRRVYDGRYMALNDFPEATLEFRMFNSTIRIDRWMKNIQFVKSIIEFCKVKDAGKMKYTNYIAYIQRRKDEYSDLYNFMKEAIKREGNRFVFNFNMP